MFVLLLFHILISRHMFFFILFVGFVMNQNQDKPQPMIVIADDDDNDAESVSSEGIGTV